MPQIGCRSLPPRLSTGGGGPAHEGGQGQARVVLGQQTGFEIVAPQEVGDLTTQARGILKHQLDLETRVSDAATPTGCTVLCLAAVLSGGLLRRAGGTASAAGEG